MPSARLAIIGVVNKGQFWWMSSQGTTKEAREARRAVLIRINMCGKSPKRLERFPVRIIVCIKQVPDTGEAQLDAVTGTLKREGIETVVNPFDMFAIEEGIRLKERYGGRVTVMSMGPPKAEEALREALALGCDEAFLLSDKALTGADTLATAYTLACGIVKLRSYDVIICGLKTTDGDTGQVGPELAEELDVPHFCYVRKIIEIKDNLATVEVSLDDVYLEVETPLPCLLTVTKETNLPRLPSFKRKLEARRMPVTTWNAEDLQGDMSRFGLSGSPTRVVKIQPPLRRLAGEMIAGDAETQARILVERLSERKLV